MKRIDPMLFAAGFGAAAMIAGQVAGKATRDALFLSYFPVSALPVMVIIASLLSIAAGLLTARLMTSVAPSLLVPRVFLLSSILHFVEWWIAGFNPVAAAILVYLQIAILGSALISGFWSMLDDRFDARTARKHFGRIVAASTFGGLIGGVAAQFVGSAMSVANMLPVLAAFHFICALIATTLAPGCKGCKSSKRVGEPKRQSVSGFTVVTTVPYVRNLALLILSSTLGAALLDYVFKVKAAAVYTDGAELVRFFALFYTVSGVATFLVQSIFSRIAVQRLGIAGTVGSLPLTLAFGSLGGLVLPELSMAFAARTGEAVLRTSFFKSAYEMLYTAIPRRERRATKTILDVGVERSADLLGALVLGMILLIASQNSTSIILGIAAGLGLAGFWISRRLQRAYVEALENNLLSQSMSTQAGAPRAIGGSILQPLINMVTDRTQRRTSAAGSAHDRTVRHMMDLASADAEVVRRRLGGRLEPELAAHIIRLLAWDAVSTDAIEALKRIGPRITGQLVDALLDPSMGFVVRRRIPRILVEFDSQRAVNGLVLALSDKRFEVRFHAAQALAQIQRRNGDIAINRVSIIRAVEHELDVSPEVWRKYHIIDTARRAQDGPLAIEHVFRLLELVFPREPLQIAYHAIASPNDPLKGTSLEYLENVLPLRVWQRMLPLFEESALAPALVAS